MIQINDGQCGKCAHFGADDNDAPKLVQIRISGQANEDVVESCGHPENEPRSLKVSANSTCAGFTPAKVA